MTQRTTDELTDEDYEALANLRYALRRFTDFSSHQVQTLGLTPQQHQALLAIKGLLPRSKGMSIGMLADRLLVAPRSATALVDRLGESGLVERQPAASGARKQMLILTPKSEDILKKLSDAHLHEIREMAPELTVALRALQDRRKLEKIAWMA